MITVISNFSTNHISIIILKFAEGSLGKHFMIDFDDYIIELFAGAWGRDKRGIAPPPHFLPDQFCNFSKTEEKLWGGEGRFLYDIKFTKSIAFRLTQNVFIIDEIAFRSP